MLFFLVCAQYTERIFSEQSIYYTPITHIYHAKSSSKQILKSSFSSVSTPRALHCALSSCIMLIIIVFYSFILHSHEHNIYMHVHLLTTTVLVILQFALHVATYRIHCFTYILKTAQNKYILPQHSFIQALVQLFYTTHTTDFTLPTSMEMYIWGWSYFTASYCCGPNRHCFTIPYFSGARRESWPQVILPSLLCQLFGNLQEESVNVICFLSRGF